MRTAINAFFIRNDLADAVLPLVQTPKAFPSRYRDSRDQSGHLSFAGGLERLALIKDMPVVDVETGETLLLGEIDRLYSQEWLDAMV